MSNVQSTEPKIVANPCARCPGTVVTPAQHRGPVVCMRCGQIFYVGFRRVI